MAREDGMDLRSLPKTQPLGLDFGSRNAGSGGACQDGCPEVGERADEVVGVRDRAPRKGVGWQSPKTKNRALVA